MQSKKRNMRNISSKILLSLMLCFTLIGSYSTQSLAYNSEDYEVDDEGDYHVTNWKRDGATVKVSFFLLVQEYYTNAQFIADYNFYCLDGSFVEDGVDYGSGSLAYTFRSQNATSNYYQTIDGVGDIWAMNFVIEPGTYIFASPGGLDHICILPTSLGSPLITDGYTEAEEVVVKDGDEIQLYGTYGDWEWQKSDEALQAIMDFAKEKERQLLTYSSVPSINTLTVENDSEKPEEITEESSEEEFVPNEEIEQVKETKPVFEEAQPVGTQKDSKTTLIFGGIIVFAVLAYCFWIKKKDEK